MPLPQWTVLPLRLVLLPFVPLVLVLIGTLGYHFIEGWAFIDALYTSVITLTTIGYGDFYPRTTLGKFFTMALALGGIFTLFYAATEVIRAIVSGEVHAILGRRLMERNLADLKNHLIVCGFGRMGRLVCKEFSSLRIPFVVIERENELLENFQMPHGFALHGDATSDEILKRAGVDRARALITVVASDADNLYITMTARLLNDRLFIVARAEEEHAEQKLTRAGASRVVSPYMIGGFRMAQAVLRPTVVDFIELATRTEHLDLQIEETQISPRSPLVGVTLKDSQLSQKLRIIIVTVKKSNGKMVFNPPAETILEPGDILIALGHRAQLDQLETLANR